MASPPEGPSATDARRQFCYLTTHGRGTGRPHRIEIWFALRDRAVYLLSGGGDRSDWVKNLRREPRVRFELAGVSVDAHARVVEDAEEDAAARRLLATKYQGWQEGRPLSSWARTALPVAIDLPADGPR
jgi:deazaflavin-dependent oxidoreductase (nitroreductase family)